MSLRPFRPDDASAAREVFRTRLGSYFDPSESADFESTLAMLQEPPEMAENYRYWTGWIQAQVVAFGGVAWLNECGFLCWGMVHADHGGNGCGRQLLAHRIDTLQSVGVKSIFSDTSQLTEGFFARHGFQAFYREPEHFGPGIDLVGMELSLDGTVRGPSRIQPDNLLSDRLGEFA